MVLSKRSIAITSATAGLLFAIPIAWPWAKLPLVVVAGESLAVLGVVVLLRAGLVSFGQAMFLSVGGYAVASVSRLSWGHDIVLELLTAVAASTALACAVGPFLVRYRGIFFAMLNLAISMVLYALASKSYAITGGSDGLRVVQPSLFGLSFERPQFETVLYGMAVVVAGLCAFFVRTYLATPSGAMLSALETNETRLEYLGVSARQVLLQGYVIAAALAGAGGAFYAVGEGLVTPELGYWLRSGELVFIAVFGGYTQVSGAFVGSLAFEAVRLYASAYIAGAWQLVLGMTLLVIILFAPHGLMGILHRVFAGNPDLTAGDVPATSAVRGPA